MDSHKGKEIGKVVEACVLKWGLEDRLMSLTVDNASSNDVAIRYLKTNFHEKLVLDGSLFHMRCVCHVLNLIVKDGLSSVKTSIARIRSAVRYVRSSPSRAKLFAHSSMLVKVSCKGSVCLDVSTRWNSTFIMLETALKFEKSFNRFKEDDPDFNIRVMGKQMREKFDKYYGDLGKTNIMMLVSVVLDPRYKLRFLKYSFKKLYPNDYAKVDVVCDDRGMSSPPPVTVLDFVAGISSTFVPVGRPRTFGRPPPPHRRRRSTTLADAYRRHPRRRGDPDAVLDVENDVEVPPAREEAAENSTPSPPQPAPPQPEDPAPSASLPLLPDSGYDFMGVSQPHQVVTWRSGGFLHGRSEPGGVWSENSGCASPLILTYHGRCCGEGSSQGDTSTIIKPLARNPFREQLSRSYYRFDSLPLVPPHPIPDGSRSMNMYRPPDIVVRVKTYTFSDLDIMYIVRVQGRPHQRLGDIFEEWGLQRNLARGHIEVMYEDKHYTTVDTVQGVAKAAMDRLLVSNMSKYDPLILACPLGLAAGPNPPLVAQLALE
uniref:hAT-like transposase RNase-H fold domain-containing protein n=1 Tax=Chenopodium quinoa TaxID=63459 RepID=A0A803MRM7_CHEQI